MSSIEKVVIGTWPLSGDFGVRSLAAIEACVTRAMDAGIRRFDTAPNYGFGFAESMLGMILSGDKSVEIYTKFGNQPFLGKNFEPDALEASLGQSLKRLRRDSVEGVFLHNPRSEVSDYGPIAELFQTLKADGRVKRAGISGAKGTDYSTVPKACLEIFQQDANLLYLDEILTEGRRFEMFFARSPLATGILSGKLSTETTYPADDHRANWLTGDRLSSLVRRVEAIQSILPKGIDVPGAARRFLLHHPAIDRVIFGLGQPGHLDGIVEDIEAGPLSEDLTKALVDLNRRDFGRPAAEAKLGY